MAYNQTLIDGGHWISAANLQPTPTATTLRVSPPPVASPGVAMTSKSSYSYGIP